MGHVKSRYDDTASFGTIIKYCKAIYRLMWTIFFSQELSGSIKILLTILERNLALVKRKNTSIQISRFKHSPKKTEMCIHQEEYIAEIKYIKVGTPSQKERRLLTQEIQQLCRVAGQLNWVSTQTRPNMVYAASAA